MGDATHPPKKPVEGLFALHRRHLRPPKVADVPVAQAIVRLIPYYRDVLEVAAVPRAVWPPFLEAFLPPAAVKAPPTALELLRQLAQQSSHCQHLAVELRAAAEARAAKTPLSNTQLAAVMAPRLGISPKKARQLVLQAPEELRSGVCRCDEALLERLAAWLWDHVRLQPAPRNRGTGGGGSRHRRRLPTPASDEGEGAPPPLNYTGHTWPVLGTDSGEILPVAVYDTAFPSRAGEKALREKGAAGAETPATPWQQVWRLNALLKRFRPERGAERLECSLLQLADLCEQGNPARRVGGIAVRPPVSVLLATAWQADRLLPALAGATFTAVKVVWLRGKDGRLLVLLNPPLDYASEWGWHHGGRNLATLVRGVATPMRLRLLRRVA